MVTRTFSRPGRRRRESYYPVVPGLGLQVRTNRVFRNWSQSGLVFKPFSGHQMVSNAFEHQIFYTCLVTTLSGQLVKGEECATQGKLDDIR